jgi:hypothetical protein
LRSFAWNARIGGTSDKSLQDNERFSLDAADFSRQFFACLKS